MSSRVSALPATLQELVADLRSPDPAVRRELWSWSVSADQLSEPA